MKAVILGGGTSTRMVLPPEIINRLNLGNGDTILFDKTPGKITLIGFKGGG